MDDNTMLAHLQRIADTEAQVDRSLRAWVDELRRRRVTWARIGEALEISPQSAWERFSPT